MVIPSKTSGHNDIAKNTEEFYTLCGQLLEINRHNASDYHQVELLGRDCYRWRDYVIKSSPGLWNFKTRQEKKILQYICSQVNSRHFPELVADITTTDRCFILLKYVPVHDMYTQFYQNKLQNFKLLPGIIRSIERQGNTILSELRHLGIMHRDITPSNFLFDYWRRRLILIDFGYAILNGTEIEMGSAEEQMLLEKAVSENLGGKYRDFDVEFSLETDLVSFEKIIKELMQKSPWLRTDLDDTY